MKSHAEIVVLQSLILVCLILAQVGSVVEGHTESLKLSCDCPSSLQMKRDRHRLAHDQYYRSQLHFRFQYLVLDSLQQKLGVDVVQPQRSKVSQVLLQADTQQTLLDHHSKKMLLRGYRLWVGEVDKV